MQQPTQSSPKNFNIPKNFHQDNDGWTKVLDNLPAISRTEMDNFQLKTSKNVLNSSTSVKKTYKRGEAFIQERYIDMDFVYSKQNDDLFFIKAKCNASKKPRDYGLSLALSKNTKEIVHSYCECPAGDGGLCSHSFALIQLVAKWSIDGLKYIPSEESCTSKPCQWSQRKKSTFMDQKQPMSSLPIKRKNNTSTTSTVQPKLYDARVNKMLDINRLNKFKLEMLGTPICNIFQSSTQPLVKSRFGDVPLGSPLSYQYPILDCSLNVTCSFEVTNLFANTVSVYPAFPVHKYMFITLRDYLDRLDDLSLATVQKLSIDFKTAEWIERETRSQASSTLWHEVRQNRFTASKFLHFNIIKTPKGLASFAKSLLSPKTPNYFLSKKLEYGRVNEPVALQKYEDYFKNLNHELQITTSGVVIQSNAFILGASPDGKVIDHAEGDIYGLVEIKCPEKYHDFDLADIAQVEKNFCLHMINDQIKINKEHPYYDQITMQMALTGTSWCDFVVYSQKSLIIDRVYYDDQHWRNIQRKIYEFYFKYFLPCLMESSDV